MSKIVDGVEIYDMTQSELRFRKPKPAFDAKVVYDVSYIGYQVARFDNENDAVELAKDTARCWDLLRQGFPDNDIKEGYKFQVSKYWSSYDKGGEK